MIVWIRIYRQSSVIRITSKPVWMIGKVRKSVKIKYNLYIIIRGSWTQIRTLITAGKYLDCRNECNKNEDSWEDKKRVRKKNEKWKMKKKMEKKNKQEK